MLCLFDNEDKLNPHQIAWMERDWDKVKILTEEFKPSTKNELFEILNNINVDKGDLNVSSMNYSKYMIDNMLSRHIECMQAVHVSNLVLHGLPDQAHHNYMKILIPRGKRFSKNLKLDEDLKNRYIIKLIMVYYQVNSYTAFSYKELLEHKGKLDEFLKKAKALATDSFIKSITKNPKEIKELKSL